MQTPKQFKGAAESFQQYWKAYGGWRAAIGSPYLLVSVVLAVFMAPLWLRPNWWDIVLDVMPNVLGFSLGGFAIFLAFGDDGFRRLIAGQHHTDGDGEQSPYLDFSAAFLHFIVVQVIAVLFSLFAKSFYFVELGQHSKLLVLNEIVKPIWWFVGFGLFCYAICSALAAAMAIFTLTRSFDDYLSTSDADDTKA